MEVFQIISNWIDVLTNYLISLGPLMGCFLVFIESILPILPLFVFVTLNFLAFGSFLGFIISWICTILGCLLSYFIFLKKIQVNFLKKFGHYNKVKEYTKKIKEISLEQLTLIIALPCTPAFLVNIASGLSNMPFKKFVLALFIGKAAMIYFYGFIGTSFFKSLTNPACFIKVLILLLCSFLLCKLVKKKINIT